MELTNHTVSQMRASTIERTFESAIKTLAATKHHFPTAIMLEPRVA